MKKLIVILSFLFFSTDSNAITISGFQGSFTSRTYINTNIISNSNDGYIWGEALGYETAHLTSTSYDISDSLISIGQEKHVYYYVFRGFLKFDTSSIPDDATISKVTLTLTVKDDASETANFDVIIKKANWSANDPIDSAEDREGAYDTCHDATADSNIWRNTNGISTNTNYTSGALDTTWISKTGSTYYCLMSSLDISSSVPASGDEYINIYSQEDTNVIYKPTLSIEYFD